MDRRDRDPKDTSPMGDGSKRTTSENEFSRSNARTTEHVMDQASERAQETTEQAQETAEKVRSQAKELAGTVGEKAKSTLDKQKVSAANRLDDIARTMHHVSDRMREDEQEGIAKYVDQAADRLEGFSHTVRSKSVNEMLSDVEQYARDQPEVFVGGAFLLGLLTARFLKSSGQAAQSQQRASGRPGAEEEKRAAELAERRRMAMQRGTYGR